MVNYQIEWTEKQTTATKPSLVFLQTKLSTLSPSSTVLAIHWGKLYDLGLNAVPFCVALLIVLASSGSAFKEENAFLGTLLHYSLVKSRY